jgi:predicted TPR repeat methyltransferase
MNSAVSSEYFRSDWHGRVRLPSDRRPQDAEWCEIKDEEGWRRIRFHDYAEIYRERWLYDHLFYGLLECRSPQRVVGLLAEVHAESPLAQRPLRVIDVGAGNGIVGHQVRKAGAEYVLGIDILPEARIAAEKERPDVYDDYIVGDLTQPTLEMEQKLARSRANCLTCVAALGFGDIPPLAYANAVKFVECGGLIAFNIKAEFLDSRYTHGFSELIRRAQAGGILRIEALRRYRHRLSTAGDPIFYTALVATKLAEIPPDMLVDPA